MGDFLEKLPANTKFFHPLPRDATAPELPFWLDDMEYNGWDQQSQNGYFTRIILLAIVGGQLGDDFVPAKGAASPEMPTSSHAALTKSDLLEEISIEGVSHLNLDYGLAAKSGVIIGGVAKGESHEKI